MAASDSKKVSGWFDLATSASMNALLAPIPLKSTENHLSSSDSSMPRLFRSFSLCLLTLKLMSSFCLGNMKISPTSSKESKRILSGIISFVTSAADGRTTHRRKELPATLNDFLPSIANFRCLLNLSVIVDAKLDPIRKNFMLFQPELEPKWLRIQPPIFIDISDLPFCQIFRANNPTPSKKDIPKANSSEAHFEPPKGSP